MSAELNQESLAILVNDHLPKLVELLQDMEPQYRARVLRAAFVLLGDEELLRER